MPDGRIQLREQHGCIQLTDVIAIGIGSSTLRPAPRRCQESYAYLGSGLIDQSSCQSDANLSPLGAIGPDDHILMPQDFATRRTQPSGESGRFVYRRGGVLN